MFPSLVPTLHKQTFVPPHICDDLPLVSSSRLKWLSVGQLLSSSGSSLTSWLTPRQVYEKSREDPEIGFVMGWCQVKFKGISGQV